MLQKIIEVFIYFKVDICVFFDKEKKVEIMLLMKLVF